MSAPTTSWAVLLPIHWHPAPGRARRRVDPGIPVYYSMTMSGTKKKTATVLTIRVDALLTRSLSREARRRRTTKSEVAREILAAGLEGQAGDLDLAKEARRQSLLVGRRRSEREALAFIEQLADTRGWK
jgi:hypothetical protein